MQANPLPEVHQISGDESIFTGPTYYMNFVPYGSPYWAQPKYVGFVYGSPSMKTMTPMESTSPRKHHLILLILIIIVILLIYKLG